MKGFSSFGEVPRDGFWYEFCGSSSLIGDLMDGLLVVGLTGEGSSRFDVSVVAGV